MFRRRFASFLALAVLVLAAGCGKPAGGGGGHGGHAHTAPHGGLLVEIGFTQEADVRAILAEQPELEVGPTIKDLAGHPRVIRARKRS